MTTASRLRTTSSAGIGSGTSGFGTWLGVSSIGGLVPASSSIGSTSRRRPLSSSKSVAWRTRVNRTPQCCQAGLVRELDYVLVGAGSAGCVLASRLTEDPAVSVLLLEAGGEDRRREIRVPAAFSRLFGSEVDWSYRTEPQPGLAGRR